MSVTDTRPGTTRGRTAGATARTAPARPGSSRTGAARAGTARTGTAKTGAATPARPTSATRAALRSAWDAPVTSYYLIGSVTLVLLALGLVFVLSSSAVFSMRDSDSPLTEFLGQAQFAAIGLPLAFVVSRFPVRLLRHLAWPAYLGALGLQALPLVGFGHGVGGNIAWVSLGPLTFQPAEVAKVGLALWLGAILATKRDQLGSIRHMLLPLVGAVAMIGLQFLTHDFGTTLVLIALVAGALWVAGLPMRVFVVLGIGALGVAGFMATQGTTRMARIMALLDPGSLDADGLGYQSRRALEALGTGGVSGVGLGGSRSKWLYLPEAHNDFILAVVGEELGLLGTLLVLGLFAALMVGLSRVVLRHPHPFVKITTAAIAAWLLAQALVNIGVVINVIPVIGLPLPLVSAGGTSLVTTLLALGIVLAFARDEPGARDALLARRGTVRRSFGVLARRAGRR